MTRVNNFHWQYNFGFSRSKISFFFSSFFTQKMNEWTQGRQPSNTVFRKIQKFKMVDIRETMYMSIQLKDWSKFYFFITFWGFPNDNPLPPYWNLIVSKSTKYCTGHWVIPWLLSSYADWILIDFGTFLNMSMNFNVELGALDWYTNPFAILGSNCL